MELLSDSMIQGSPIVLYRVLYYNYCLSPTIHRRSMSSSLVPTVEDVSELGGCDIVDEEAMGNVLGISTGFCVCVIQGVNCF